MLSYSKLTDKAMNRYMAPCQRVLVYTDHSNHKLNTSPSQQMVPVFLCRLREKTNGSWSMSVGPNEIVGRRL